MKNYKMPLLVLLIEIISLCLAGCGDRNTGTKRGQTINMDRRPVFETDNISGITFFSQAPDADPVAVPDEYMSEITQWLGSFLPDEEIDGHSIAALARTVIPSVSSMRTERSSKAALIHARSTVRGIV